MQPDQNSSPSPSTTQPSAPNPSVGSGGDYDFILSSQKPAGKLPSLIGGSKSARIIIASGGLLVLIIAFVIIKNLLTVSPFKTDDFYAVVEQQQAIVHILTTDLQSSNSNNALSDNNQNFAVTARLSLSSDQSSTLAYLKSNNVVMTPLQESQDVRLSLDKQLSSALTTNSFNQTFTQIMQTKLAAYESSLVTAYKTTHGPKGKTLLKEEYQTALLLTKQLALPAG